LILILRFKAFIFAFYFWIVLPSGYCSGAVLTELYMSVDTFPFTVISFHPIAISLMNS